MNFNYEFSKERNHFVKTLTDNGFEEESNEVAMKPDGEPIYAFTNLKKGYYAVKFNDVTKGASMLEFNGGGMVPISMPCTYFGKPLRVIQYLDSLIEQKGQNAQG